MRVPNPDRMTAIKQAFEEGATEAEIHEYTKIDPWFLAQVGGSRSRRKKSGWEGPSHLLRIPELSGPFVGAVGE